MCVLLPKLSILSVWVCGCVGAWVRGCVGCVYVCVCVLYVCVYARGGRLTELCNGGDINNNCSRLWMCVFQLGPSNASSALRPLFPLITCELELARAILPRACSQDPALVQRRCACSFPLRACCAAALR